MTWRRFLLVPLVLAWQVACEEGNGASEGAPETTPGPRMRPGDNCLRCHNPRGQAAQRPWTAAGTVFSRLDARATQGVSGVTLRFKDREGHEVESLVTNEAGNFYTDRALPDPYFVSLEYQGKSIEMPCAPPAGSCNACHSPNPVGFAPGRIYLPGAHPEAGPFDCEDWEAGGSGRTTSRAERRAIR